MREGAVGRFRPLSKPYDVIVAGGGNAALCAALTAREAGASVLLLESSPRWCRGGNSRHTRNIRYAHAAANEYLTGPYLEEEFFEDLLAVTGGQTDEELARLTIRRSRDLGRWMEAHGCRFQPAMRGTLHLARTNAFFLGGGKALMNAYYKRAERLGVDIVTSAEAVDLDMEDGLFRRIHVRMDNLVRPVEGRSLVVATGGFQANRSWLREHWGEAADRFIVRGTPYNQGRMLRVLLRHGAVPVGDPTQCHAVAVDARAPEEDGGIVTRLDCISFGIVVNKDARRFYDEGEDFWPKRYAIWGRLVAQQPDQIAYAVIDARSMDLFMPSVFPPIAAGSVEELAERIGLDPRALRATVDRFNAAVTERDFDPSRLDDCSTTGITPPKSHWARKIERPPFYAYPLRPGITFTYLGVKVDACARVMGPHGPYENLFAAGEIMSGNILGRGYMAGFGMTIGTVFGREAGKEAVRYVVRSLQGS
ncbi:MAG: FAD-dependent tricarballylate dehydrogenase TcuA [Desulfacinum sp.]|jgi:tricarballylate dehydrogenase|nr:FAD-dependent tricarballylate dehydrogenase TcuA [Desulfacinum sp.]MBZ4658845.1 tricarballylate dehydrogenase [Desulfacinum sp.]